MFGKSIRLAALAVLMLAAVALGQPPAGDDPRGGGKSPEPKKAPKTTALEESLAQALANNPDVRVAEAKLREAEAELNRARMQVMQKVSEQNNKLEPARQIARSAADYVEYVKRLGGAVARVEVIKAEDELVKAKAEVARIEADLNALLGRVPGAKAEADPTIRRGLEFLLRQQNANARWQGPGVIVPDRPESLTELSVAALLAAGKVVWLPETVRPEMAQRVRKFLNAPVKFDKPVEHVPVKDLIDFLMRASKSDVPLLIQSQAGDGNVQLGIKGELTVGAVVQALEDLQPELAFAVRDYGILVTVRDKMPAKAVRLLDFWRSERPADPLTPPGQ
jgi:hypothetical protein